MKFAVIVLTAAAVAAAAAAAVQLPRDPYHALHLPGAYRALYHPTQLAALRHLAGDSCRGRSSGLYANVGSGCEKYFRCDKEQVASTEQCTEGTLFNEQFQVCDHFYNVRCGSPYEDL